MDRLQRARSRGHPDADAVAACDPLRRHPRRALLDRLHQLRVAEDGLAVVDGGGLGMPFRRLTQDVDQRPRRGCADEARNCGGAGGRGSDCCRVAATVLAVTSTGVLSAARAVAPPWGARRRRVSHHRVGRADVGAPYLGSVSPAATSGDVHNQTPSPPDLVTKRVWCAAHPGTLRGEYRQGREQFRRRRRGCGRHGVRHRRVDGANGTTCVPGVATHRRKDSMPVITHDNPSRGSYALWFGTRLLIRPLLKYFPLTTQTMKFLYLADAPLALAPSRKVSSVRRSNWRVVRPSTSSRRGPVVVESDTAILYLHGGAFIVCGLATHRRSRRGCPGARRCRSSPWPTGSCPKRAWGPPSTTRTWHTGN